MLFQRDCSATLVAIMSSPNFEANPAELMFASAGNMNTAIVFDDRLLTHWTFLHHNTIYPLMIFD